MQVAGRAPSSFVSDSLQGNPGQNREFVIKWTAASSYVAGSDTVCILFFRRLHLNMNCTFTSTRQTDATITAFFLAMVLYPEVQRKAQAEIDAVIGPSANPNRLPTFSDRDKDLPYVNAIVKELHRWHTVVPQYVVAHSMSTCASLIACFLGIPHAVTEDDEYVGFRIPKGSIIVPNVWYNDLVSS